MGKVHSENVSGRAEGFKVLGFPALRFGPLEKQRGR